MSVTINCGFVRGLILSGCYDNPSSCVYDQIVVDYEKLFKNYPNFWTIEKRRLKDRFKEYRDFIRKNPKVNTDIKTFVISTFNKDEWLKLPMEEKEKHSLQNCKVRIILFVLRFILLYSTRT